MRTLKVHKLPQRVRVILLMTGLLIGLLAIHSLLRGNLTDYTYLIWNFALAAVPALMIYVWRSAERWRFRVITSVVVALLWLLFLPNTFYLLTEFTHLNPDVLVNLPGGHTTGSIVYGRGSALYVFDSLMMLVAAVFGAYTGSIALVDGFHTVRRLKNAVTARFTTAIVIVLVAIGAYLGRYGRWNSWDIATQPGHIVTEFWHQFTGAATFERFVVFTGTILLFELVCLYAVCKLDIADDINR